MEGGAGLAAGATGDAPDDSGRQRGTRPRGADSRAAAVCEEGASTPPKQRAAECGGRCGGGRNDAAASARSPPFAGRSHRWLGGGSKPLRLPYLEIPANVDGAGAP